MTLWCAESAPLDLAQPFSVMHRWQGELWVRKGYENRIPVNGTSLASGFQGVSGCRVYRGRGDCFSVPIGCGERAVLRHYRHGGILASWTGDLFWGWRPRPLDELAASEALRNRGVPTPEVLALFWKYRGGMFYQADIVTREILDSHTLWQILEEPFLIPSGGSRRVTFRVAGQTLAQAHAVGLHHPDLNLKNMLIEWRSGSPRAWILDLDRATLVSGLSDNKRISQLRRLGRSYDKVRRPAASMRDALYFLRGYFGSGWKQRLVHFDGIRRERAVRS